MDLRDLFDSLTDEELVRRVSSRGLTDEALQFALSELACRGLVDPRRPDTTANPPDTSLVDLVSLERDLPPGEAGSLACSLQSAGIPYVYGDIRRVLEGRRAVVVSVSILVHPASLADAQEALAAFRRGDLAIDENFDPSTEA